MEISALHCGANNWRIGEVNVRRRRSWAAGIVLLDIVLANVAHSQVERSWKLMLDREVIFLGVGSNQRMLRIH